MTRINTNVASLVGRNNLARSNASLSQSLTRLSTGLRINTGKDDPAGLIASENLRSDITSIRKAISNTDRANQVIATSDSALGQVSSLLNDIRGLVTESANAGALSAEQIAANQAQVDSSLEALNRIAQTTTFQGRRLLDGSLDFLTTAGTNYTNISNLQIDQANLGATGSVAVDIDVTTAATRATVGIANIPAAATASTGNLAITVTQAAVAATGNVDINLAAVQSTGSVNYTTTAAAGITITALSGGAAGGAAGAASGGIDLVIVDSNATAGGIDSTAYNAGTNTITVTADLASGSVSEDEIAAAIQASNGGADFTSTAVGTTALAAGDAGTYANVALGGRDASTETIAVTSALGNNLSITIAEGAAIGATPTVSGSAGAGYTITVDNTAGTTVQNIRAAIASITEVSAATYAGAASYLGATDTPPAADTLTGGTVGSTSTETIAITTTTGNAGFNISLVENASATAGTPVVTGSAGSGYTVTVNNTGNTTVQQIRAAIAGIAEVASATYAGAATYNATSSTPPATLALSGGSAGGLTAAVRFELSGKNGSEVLSFGVGTSITELIAGINLVSDATGVSANNTATATTLSLTSNDYGSASFVDINIINEGAGATPAGTFTTAVGTGSRADGTDVVASINGVSATGKGNDLSINTATLDLSASLTAGFTGTASFTITGGGALFQLGPDVVSNQQARLGIGSVNTARLGGTAGKLFQLQSGGSADLASDPTLAASIVEEAIDQITSLRGRLGAFQRTTLETNRNALNDTLVNLQDAESAIRDADFAEETANLTRSQILVQSGTRVLSIANSNPQNVLALLG